MDPSVFSGAIGADLQQKRTDTPGYAVWDHSVNLPKK